MIRLAQPSKDNIRLLERVYEVYPEEVPMDVWLDQLKEGHAFLYEQASELPTIDYAGVVEIKEKYLQARVGGGLDGRMNVPEMFNFLKFMCHTFSKPALRLYGRKGWWRHLKHLDFKLLKEVHSHSRSSFIYEHKLTTREEQEVHNGR